MTEANRTSHDGRHESVVSPAHAEIVDAGSADAWSGPHTEYNRYGQPTGHEYVRCRDCGVEVLADARKAATHRAGCSHE